MTRQAADFLERKQAEGLTIVVVEDHDNLRRAVSVFLRQLGDIPRKIDQGKSKRDDRRDIDNCGAEAIVKFLRA